MNLLRLLFLLVFLIVGHDSWTGLFIHQGPLWMSNQLAGSPAAEMTRVFIGVPVIALVMPWKYFVQTYVLNRPRPRLALGAAA